MQGVGHLPCMLDSPPTRQRFSTSTKHKTQERLPQDVLCLKDMNNLSLQAWTFASYGHAGPCEGLKGNGGNGY